ncbi:MAG: 16S rRNA (cytosine(1402)-N(4))-methyltransferase RsmH [Sphingomonadales bacterium]|nr:16S rRNA (cytosine(1402)-N(4))-methyltransferase RsmH [Sphingomonadales bacterium]
MTGSSGNTPHISVLRDEVLAALSPRDTDIIVDGTFGAGGYTRAILEASDCRVYGIDRDPRAIAIGRAMEKEFDGRLKVLEGCYSDMESLLAAEGVDAVDGVALDIGVSSMQIDEAERGFSFQKDGPLDMRMAQHGETAADVINTYAEEDLADIFWRYGDEKKSRAIARAICEDRLEKPYERTLELAGLVERVKGRKRKAGKQAHPATYVFQALRIYVNDELGELERGLGAAERLLGEGGRLCVVSFHSLEDRRVKKFMRERAGETSGTSRHLPIVSQNGPSPSFTLPKRKATKPSATEESANPRARSARLRVAVRTAAPAWGSSAHAKEGGGEAQ